MRNSLRGLTAVVTGSASGVGAATARTLAQEGADVVGFDIQKDPLSDHFDSIEEKTSVEALPLEVDLTDVAAVETAIDTVIEEFGSIDVLVNNAGIAVSGEVDGMETDTYHTQMGVNVDGAFFTTRAALPHIREASGNIIFMGSYAGQFPRPYSPVYAATKWWIRGFAKSLAGQISEDSVAITVINPTEVYTDFADGSMKERYDEGNIASPEDIAEAIVFAARQEPPLTVNELDLYRRNRFRDF